MLECRSDNDAVWRLEGWTHFAAGVEIVIGERVGRLIR